MGEMENKVELFYEKLSASTNPGQILLEFFREVTGQNGGRSEIIAINRLIRLFGRFTTYFAILELSKYAGNLNGDIYPLLFTICKSRFEKIHQENFSPAQESLAREITNIEKEAERVRKQATKMKVPTSEGLK